MQLYPYCNFYFSPAKVSIIPDTAKLYGKKNLQPEAVGPGLEMGYCRIANAYTRGGGIANPAELWSVKSR